VPAPAAQPGPAVPLPAPQVAPQTHRGRPVRPTRNPNPDYDMRIRKPRAQVADAAQLQAAANRNVARGTVRRVTFASPLVTAEHSVPGSGELGDGEPQIGEPSQRSKQQWYRQRRLHARRKRRLELRAAAQAARAMQQLPAKVEAAAADASAGAADGGRAPTPAFAGSAWYRALTAEGADSLERQSVRADMQALAQACAAVAPTVLAAPRSVAQAKRSDDWPQWQEAIDVELQSFFDHEVWDKGGCVLPAGKSALPSHIVLDRKRDGRYKARLVAGGNHQQPGIDFNATFAPVCSYRTLRMIAAVAGRHGLSMRQFDIKTAFLNGVLEEEVFVRPPAGFEYLAGGYGRVLRLRRAMYGLRQAPRAWNKCLEAELTKRGFVQSNADPGLWLLHGEEGAVMCMFYVDDGLVAARSDSEAEALVDLVADMFSIRKLGEPDDVLGIEVLRDWEAGTITLCQERKAEALAEAFGVAGQRRSMPMSPAVYGDLHAARDGEERADKVSFQSGIGSLLHLVQCTRPDIAVSVGALAAFASEPTALHFDAMLDVVRYVGSTATRGLTYGHAAAPLELWCDANFAACTDTRRSTTGWVATMYGGAVSWESRKQPTAAASTMDAEYQACGAVAREALSLQKALAEFETVCSEFAWESPLTVFCDNHATLTLCQESKESQRVKHIDIIHHFARDHVASGELQFLYCRSEDNMSDVLTKALPKGVFETCLVGLGMLVL